MTTGVMAEEQSGRLTGVHLGEFGAWMASEQERIFLLCRRMLQDAAEADCATQDVFFKAFKALNARYGSFDATDDWGRWLTRIAVNTCLDRLRSSVWRFWRRRARPEEEQSILLLAPSQAPDAERQLFAQQVHQRLESALERLSPRQRAVFSLRHYEEQSIEEIAVTLKLEPGTVKAHLARAVAKMRGELTDLYMPSKSQGESTRMDSAGERS